MRFKHCNIDKTDRVNRMVIGAILFFAAFIGIGKVFFMVVGFVLVVEGIIGWCSIPYLISRTQTHIRNRALTRLSEKGKNR